MADSSASITDLLGRFNDEPKAVIDELMPIVEGELKRLAVAHMSRERFGHTLQPTALVNEVYLRLIDRQRVHWRTRAQFFAFASQTMRRILVDHARGRRAEKRGGGQLTVALEEAVGLASNNTVDLLDLDLALDELARFDEPLVRIVEMRFYGGLRIEEIAAVLEVSPATASRKLTMARAWLFRHLERASDGGAIRSSPAGLPRP